MKELIKEVKRKLLIISPIRLKKFTQYKRKHTSEKEKGT